MHQILNEFKEAVQLEKNSNVLLPSISGVIFWSPKIRMMVSSINNGKDWICKLKKKKEKQTNRKKDMTQK